MEYKVLTNNSCILQYSKDREEYFHVAPLKETVKDVVMEARNYLMDRWELVSDPLSGRRARANPFLTVILQKQDKNDIAWKHILRVEQLLDIYYKNIENYRLLNQEAIKDYQTIDTSLAVSALNKCLYHGKSFEMQRNGMPICITR